MREFLFENVRREAGFQEFDLTPNSTYTAFTMWAIHTIHSVLSRYIKFLYAHLLSIWGSDCTICFRCFCATNIAVDKGTQPEHRTKKPRLLS